VNFSFRKDVNKKNDYECALEVIEERLGRIEINEHCPSAEIYQTEEDLFKVKKEKIESNKNRNHTESNFSNSNNNTVYNQNLNFKNSIIDREPPFKFSMKGINFKNTNQFKNLSNKALPSPKLKSSQTFNTNDTSSNKSNIKVTNIVFNPILKEPQVMNTDPNTDRENRKSLGKNNIFQVPVLSPRTSNIKPKNYLLNTGNSNFKMMPSTTTNKKAMSVITSEKPHEDKKPLKTQFDSDQLNLTSEKRESYSRNNDRKIFFNKETSNKTSQKKFINPFQQNTSYFGKLTNLLSKKPFSTKNSIKTFNFDKTSDRETHTQLSGRGKFEASNLTAKFVNLK
jgi:hypothetical protein